MKILLVEDHKPTRDEMRALVEGQPDMTVIAEAETGEDAVEKARLEQPDVIIMDILLPGMNGVEATKKIREQRPDARILALSNHYGGSLLQTILDAGGQGYVRKNRAFEELIPAIRSVSAGRRYVSRGATDSKP